MIVQKKYNKVAKKFKNHPDESTIFVTNKNNTVMKRRFLSLTLTLLAGVSTMMAQTAIRRSTEVFSIVGKDTLRMDVYVNPTTEIEGEGRPVMLYVHGGGFNMGSRINAAQQVYFHYLADRGWLVASIDYRLAGTSTNEDGSINNPYQVKSTLDAIRYACIDAVTATNYLLSQSKWKINPKQIVLAGGSAGAITSLHLEYELCNDEEYTKKLPDGFNYAGVISQAGCICTNDETLHWKHKPCPIMLMHGSEDYTVPQYVGDLLDCRGIGTEVIAPQLKEMDVPYWRFISKGADHVIAMLTLTKYLEEQYRFLADYVIGGQQGSVNTIVKDKEPANMADANMMVKYVPLYILGYGKYLEDMDWNNVQKPTNIVY